MASFCPVTMASTTTAAGSAPHTGGCHCKAVRYEVTGLNLDKAISCNCSHCHTKGFALAFVPAAGFKLLSGEDHLTEYRFNKKQIVRDGGPQQSRVVYAVRLT